MPNLSGSLSTSCWVLDWEPLTGNRRNHLLQIHSLDLVPSRSSNSVIKTWKLFLYFDFFFLYVVFYSQISYVPAICYVCLQQIVGEVWFHHKPRGSWWVKWEVELGLLERSTSHDICYKWVPVHQQVLMLFLLCGHHWTVYQITLDL